MTQKSLFEDSPLSFSAFRAIWLAATFSNVGTFVQDVAQAWLMLEITKSAMFVALISVCLTLPSFLFSIPAGVLADRIDRRSMLIVGQSFAAATALSLSLARATGHAGSTALLAAALGIGFASAINNPAWQSLVPELVPRRLMPEAIALNSVSFNIARVLGPAIGGYLLGVVGPSFAFLVNGVSFLAVVIVLVTHKDIERVSREGKKSHESDKAETSVAAVLSGVRIVFSTEQLRACTLSVMLFVVAAAGTMSVLPVFARHELDVDAKGYGTVVGALGLGAVIGASVMKRARKYISQRIYTAIMMALFSLAVLVAAFVHTIWVARSAFVFAGIGWVGTFSTLMALVQTHAPPHAKSRVVAVYGVSWLGVWVVAALASGAIAKATNAALVLELAAAWGLCAALATLRMPIPDFQRALNPVGPSAR